RLGRPVRPVRAGPPAPPPPGLHRGPPPDRPRQRRRLLLPGPLSPAGLPAPASCGAVAVPPPAWAPGGGLGVCGACRCVLLGLHAARVHGRALVCGAAVVALTGFSPTPPLPESTPRA